MIGSGVCRACGAVVSLVEAPLHVEDHVQAGDRLPDRMSTRPEDWAPAARAHLFGLGTLSRTEFAVEGTRMSGGAPAYGEAVFRQAAALRRRMEA